MTIPMVKIWENCANVQVLSCGDNVLFCGLVHKVAAAFDHFHQNFCNPCRDHYNTFDDMIIIVIVIRILAIIAIIRRTPSTFPQS